MSMSVSSAGSYSFMDRMVSSSMNRASKTQGNKPDTAQMVAGIIKKEDTDGDGKISASESKAGSDLFKKLDTDSDGSLTSDELVTGLKEGQSGRMRPAGPPSMDSAKMAKGIMSDEDTNEDGSLSIEETGLSTEDYNVLDTNQDGKVSVEELQAGLEARKTEMENAMATQQSGTDTNDMFDSLLQVLAQNQATDAYANQSWDFQSQSSTSQSLAITA